MSGCLKSSYGVLCLVTSWMLIAIGLTFLHLGAAVTGFVTGDVAGRFWIQHRFHVSREEAFRRPLQVRSCGNFVLRCCLTKCLAASGAKRLWLTFIGRATRFL